MLLAKEASLAENCCCMNKNTTCFRGACNPPVYLLANLRFNFKKSVFQNSIRQKFLKEE